jgi:hypothetical protein
MTSARFVTTSYENATHLNDIMFDNYVATFVTADGHSTIVSQLQSSYNDNSIPMSNYQLEQIQSLNDPLFWEGFFSTAMIYFYELREMVPPYSGQPGIVIPINTPGQLGMCVYDGTFNDGTFEYIGIAFKDPSQDITFYVEPLIIFASTDPKLSQADRDFISTLINPGG